MSSRSQRRALRFVTVLTRYVGIGGLLILLGFYMATRESDSGLVAAFVTLTGASIGADLIKDLRETVGTLDEKDPSPSEDEASEDEKE